MRNTVSYRFKLDNIYNTLNILTAKLQVHIRSSASGFNYTIFIKAIKMADTGNFDIVGCNFKNDSLRTTTQVSWDGPHLATNKGDIIETPDISSVIREVLRMPDWREGNYLDIVLFNDLLPERDTVSGYKCFSHAVIEKEPRLVITLMEPT